MRLTTAEKILIAAALAERHQLPISDAIEYADTAANALDVAVADPDRIITAAQVLAS